MLLSTSHKRCEFVKHVILNSKKKTLSIRISSHLWKKCAKNRTSFNATNQKHRTYNVIPTFNSSSFFCVARSSVIQFMGNGNWCWVGMVRIHTNAMKSRQFLPKKKQTEKSVVFCMHDENE